ncbi:hypothetical protein KNP414_05911 [Paenibacillus mucilaginosus KNP414]|uniref:Uncharacterized protein n=1 Tax=Paenibacillus mucilaginosus (strain KNP414) TaxID=1036673 RepID=F8FC34_PAEMK|nr:hypothetical protein KNP414_05911 [Paenibacillus mucilaginosus KNP414]
MESRLPFIHRMPVRASSAGFGTVRKAAAYAPSVQGGAAVY